MSIDHIIVRWRRILIHKMIAEKKVHSVLYLNSRLRIFSVYGYSNNLLGGYNATGRNS